MPSDKSETHSELLVEIDEAVAVVTINRPQVLNALNIHIVDALGLTMHRLKSDDTVRAVVITGAGDRAFVAGQTLMSCANVRLQRLTLTLCVDNRYSIRSNRWGSPLLLLLTVSHWVEGVN